MSLPDRAANVLAALLAEQRLRQGEISFVTHSFGGLIFAQLLRLAVDRSNTDRVAAAFANRIGGVLFLGTPHRGSPLATLANRLAILVRPSAATKGLSRNDPTLRELNQWFRNHAATSGIITRTLVETKTKWFGLVVEPDSADPGLPASPIPVDSDHSSIAAPGSRRAEVYRQVLRFLTEAAVAPVRKRLVSDAALEAIKDNTSETAAVLGRIERHFSAFASATVAPRTLPTHLVDSELEERVSRLRKMRFLAGADAFAFAAHLGAALTDGDLAPASPVGRARGLAWSARVLSSQPKKREIAKQFLARARSLGQVEEVQIADAFLQAYDGELSSALGNLARLDSALARGAALMILSNIKTPDEALSWLDDAGLGFSALDPDGKVVALRGMLMAGRREVALSSAVSLRDEDFNEAPALLYLAASAHLAAAVPEELAGSVLTDMPFEMAGLPFADHPTALAERRKAKEYYTRASDAAASLGCVDASKDAADKALAIACRDPATNLQARAELEQSLRDSRVWLRRVPLALHFGLKLNIATVEQEIDRQLALAGGASLEAAIARLSIALTRDDPREVAEYIGRYREQLLTHINKGFIEVIEIEMLIRSNQLDLAEERLVVLPAEMARQQKRLSALLTSARGADPREALEQQFANTNSISDLISLVHLLSQERDWTRAALYAADLFQRTGDVSSCGMHAQALIGLKNWDDAVQLFNAHSALVERSMDLQFLLAHALYERGDVARCRQVVSTLCSKRNEPRDRDLWVNATIASGDWPSLAPFVEEEWLSREDRDARELLRAAQLAQEIGSMRTRELLFAAAAQGERDPNVLVACYGAAMNSGEESAETFNWLERAAELSDSQGPVRRLSLKQVMEFDPSWQQRAQTSRDNLNSGAIPMRAAGRLVNRSLTELVVLQAWANLEGRDVRRRAPVYAYSGKHESSDLNQTALYVDSTALLTVGLLDWFGLLESSRTVYIGHSTLSWLFEERRKIQVFQPTRLTKAEEIHRLVEVGDLHRFEPTTRSFSELSAIVGEELAGMLDEATATATDQRQRIVVRSAPVHRVGSLMEEEADLSDFSNHLCGCRDIVEALVVRGQLTASEANIARTYLASHERPWPTPPAIESGAVLYLDSVAVSSLQHVGVLGKLQRGGFTVFIPSSQAFEWRDVVGYERLAANALSTLEGIRKWLAHGIERGHVVLTAKQNYDDDRLDAFEREIFAGAAKADAVVVDDRFYNQHRRIQGDFGFRPILTSIDLLDSAGMTDPDRRLSCRHRLRCAGVVFVPVSGGELISYLERSTFHGGVLLETAELAAIRESLQVVRISASLQVPEEHLWLQGVMQAFIAAIRAQWVSTVLDEVARARCVWLLNQIDLRKWSHLFGRATTAEGADERMVGQIFMLCGVGSALMDGDRARYLRWCDDVVLAPLRSEQPELFAALLKRASNFIADAAERVASGHAE